MKFRNHRTKHHYMISPVIFAMEAYFEFINHNIMLTASLFLYISQGCAVVLQGRYIEHEALKTLGGTERITSQYPTPLSFYLISVL